MNKRDLPKEQDKQASEEEVSEEEEEEIVEEPEEEYVEEEEEDGIFDFDDNFNQTGKFTINEATTTDNNTKSQENSQTSPAEKSNQYTNNQIPINNNLETIDIHIPNEAKNNKDKLDILDLDLESIPKDELINLLLKTDEPQPQKKGKKKFQLKPKNTKPNVLNSVYSNMQNMAENKDPELAEDFNVALIKILTKMMKESNNKNAEILDILISDREKVEEELRKV
jgi:hypothetical protein